MKGIIAITALALVGCAGSPNRGAPLRSECVDTGEVSSFTVMIREPGRIQEMFAHTPRSDRAVIDASHVGAFTGLNPAGQMTMVLPPLRGQADHERMALWGHELAHVICGPFHDKPDSARSDSPRSTR